MSEFGKAVSVCGPRRLRASARALAAAALVLIVVGCASVPAPAAGPEPAGVHFSRIILSPGDQLHVVVYKHDDLTRDITVPPDGVIFYPGVGDVDTTGKDVRELRKIISDGLSAYREQAILPGDTISISVFMHTEYNRQLVVPADDRVFVPQVGEIDVSSLSLSALRKKITDGLSSFVVEPQVMVDIVDLKSATRIIDPQVTIELSGLRGQRMYVLGEVKSPGAYVIDAPLTLSEVAALAGGFTTDANLRSVLIARPQGPGKPRALLLVSVEQYLKTGESKDNPVIEAGDLVYVNTAFISNAGRFFGNLARIISPLLDIEQGYWIGQNIVAGPTGNRNVP